MERSAVTMLVLGGGALFVACATAIVRACTPRWGWVDVPRAVGAYTRTVPTSGGIAFVIPLLGAFAYFIGVREGNVSLAWALVGGGSLVAAIGWADDRWDLRARWRLLAYGAAAAWALAWTGGMPTLTIGTRTVELGVVGTVIAFLAIVWMTNLVNFMDGIDGLVSAQAVVAGIVLGSLSFLAGNTTIAFALWITAAASAGFLAWNWYPARIFMGDTGAVFLGFTFAVLAVASERAHALPALTWWIIFGMFFADATWTLLRRMLRGHPPYERHRACSFHRLAARRGRHDAAVASILAWGVLLAALAWVAQARPALLLPCLAASLVLSAWRWWRWQEPMARHAVSEPECRASFARGAAR